ncbi:Mitoferrin-2 [Manis pentadactyla]|nr:Mitoferrin-2 [Manis pentadactyla]
MLCSGLRCLYPVVCAHPRMETPQCWSVSRIRNSLKDLWVFSDLKVLFLEYEVSYLLWMCVAGLEISDLLMGDVNSTMGSVRWCEMYDAATGCNVCGLWVSFAGFYACDLFEGYECSGLFVVLWWSLQNMVSLNDLDVSPFRLEVL